jgi:hypothetical protein
MLIVDLALYHDLLLGRIWLAKFNLLLTIVRDGLKSPRSTYEEVSSQLPQQIPGMILKRD